MYVPRCNPCPKPLPLNAYAHYYSSGCWGVVDVCLPLLLYLHSVCEQEVFTETYTGSGLYFKWSAGSGPNLLHWVPGLFNFVCNTRVNQRTPHPPASVSMHVCNLQFVKLGWEKCEREIRWKTKKKHYLSRHKQSAGGVSVVLQADGDHWFLHGWCEKKAETILKRRTCY